jgi:hypothetical protein
VLRSAGFMPPPGSSPRTARSRPTRRPTWPGGRGPNGLRGTRVAATTMRHALVAQVLRDASVDERRRRSRPIG